MIVNGQEIIVSDNIDLYTFLEQKNYNLNRIAVELNGIIIPKNKFKEIFIFNNDKIEIVSFVGGG
jgi:sulfur carrier protein